MFLNLILIVLLIALVAVFFKRKTLPGEGKPILYTLVVLILLAQVSPPGFDLKPPPNIWVAAWPNGLNRMAMC